jgi:hypothetical protein
MIKKPDFIPPLKIAISSDGNELEFTGHSKTSGMYSYKYTKTNTKRDPVTFTEDHLKRLIRNNETIKPLKFKKVKQ